MQEIVAIGEWLYDGSAPMLIYVIRQDYDFWYEIAKADGQLDPGEVPNLSEDGTAHYVLFRDKGEQPWWVDSPAFATCAEAMQWAAEQLPTPVRWQHV